MAYRRSLSIRANLIARRYNPSLSYILHDEDSKHLSQDETTPLRKINIFLKQRSFGTVLNKSAGSSGFFHDRRCSHYSLLPGTGMSSFSRYMSTTVSEGPDKIEYLSDVAEVLADTTLQAVASQAPAVNEVAVAAADSFFPVAALQHFIDAVHSFTGLNWWASIVLTTICIRGVTIPLLVNQLKATSKLTLMRPRLEEIKQRMEATGMEPTAMAEGQKEMKNLFKEYGVTPFTPLKGLFIQGPVFISFFLAISNMAEKVPSFKEGGAYWFVDLTTPDSLYIFPVLTALSFLITVECNMQEGLEGNPAAGTMKNVSRVLAALTVPLTMGFPKAIFCYWVTSNLFSLMYGLVLKRPGIKKFLGIPEIPKAPPTTASQSSINLFEVLKRATAMKQARTSLPVESIEPPKVAERKVSSSSALNQRLKSLEKQVKGRKRGKKSK